MFLVGRWCDSYRHNDSHWPSVLWHCYSAHLFPFFSLLVAFYCPYCSLICSFLLLCCFFSIYFFFPYFLFHLFCTNCRDMRTLDDSVLQKKNNNSWLPAVVVIQEQTVCKIKYILTCRILSIQNSVSNIWLVTQQLVDLHLIILTKTASWNETTFWHFLLVI